MKAWQAAGNNKLFSPSVKGVLQPAKEVVAGARSYQQPGTHKSMDEQESWLMRMFIVAL